MYLNLANITSLLRSREVVKNRWWFALNVGGTHQDGAAAADAGEEAQRRVQRERRDERCDEGDDGEQEHRPDDRGPAPVPVWEVPEHQGSQQHAYKTHNTTSIKRIPTK